MVKFVTGDTVNEIQKPDEEVRVSTSNEQQSDNDDEAEKKKDEAETEVPSE